MACLNHILTGGATVGSDWLNKVTWSLYKPPLCLLQYQIFPQRNIRLLLTWARKGPASTWPSSATTRSSISRWTASTTRLDPASVHGHTLDTDNTMLALPDHS
ncbi:uncharacterized protein LOC124375069 [Homalodisca vitripennis]|uniref:uncharacterized protein LOC124375069 n=1 Tax=Homalodisca vitripennis TaxID=197043 RepID=UPI001EEC6473|nr:uncharacterized protein LOC124375069 [Homalodisca vitripennis]